MARSFASLCCVAIAVASAWLVKLYLFVLYGYRSRQRIAGKPWFRLHIPSLLQPHLPRRHCVVDKVCVCVCVCVCLCVCVCFRCLYFDASVQTVFAQIGEAHRAPCDKFPVYMLLLFSVIELHCVADVSLGAPCSRSLPDLLRKCAVLRSQLILLGVCTLLRVFRLTCQV